MPVAGTMAAILADATTLLTSWLSWAGDVIAFISGEPLIMVFVLFSIAGVGIGVAKSLIRGV